MRRVTPLVTALLLAAPIASAQPRRRPPPRPPRRPPPPPAPVYVPPPPPPPPLSSSDPNDPFSGRAPPPPAPAPAPPTNSNEEPLRPNAIDIAVGGRVFTRSLVYRENVGPARPYELGVAPALRIDLAWHPGAHFTRGAGSWFGLAAQFEMAIAVASTDRSGARYDTSAWSAFAALRFRAPIRVEGLDLAALVGWRLQSFTVRDGAGAPLATVPDMDIHALHVGLSARIPLPARLALTLDAAWLHVLARGAFDDVFPDTSTAGVQAGAGLALRLPLNLEVRAAFELRGYFHALGRAPNVRASAAAADDIYLGGTLGVAYRM